MMEMAHESFINFVTALQEWIYGRKYISIESNRRYKESYYDALAVSDHDWIHGTNDPKIHQIYAGIILSCYREFETRIRVAWDNGSKSTSYDIVKQYALSRIGTFTKQDVLSDVRVWKLFVESALKKMVDEGFLRDRAGRKTHYARES